MGMAASQARFLGLTARKTNIEYEGQQVNQQRTELSNQTANYYTQLLGMGVPTPPSVEQFTKQVYSWEAVGGTTNTILQLIPKSGTPGKYVVRYSFQKEVTAAEKIGETNITRTGTAPNEKFFVGTKELTVVPATAPTDPILKEEWLAVQKMLGNDGTAAKPYEQLYKYPNETKIGSINVYMSKADVEDAGDKAMQYNVGLVTQTQELTVEAEVSFDSSGRPIGIKPDDSSAEMALSASSFKDEVAYENAMNKYEMEKYKYSKNMDDVNSKIKIMQEQDRSLELRLKQLDTEQKAVSTEMEAVSKIIQKNVESTFKTFG